ncbi:zinc finger C-x8-C-x5-C-x3-H type family protein [Artemisia annua]|uniref:Zinc finger C-x8-C-x5-C-x3-H type family protein n=1 Tax=Artemisia annua TaxID=35608 RepID=A0A2U1N243_ARTAN|nr:zinc finger C-x8-C-x5-C-x3-H type family protein [Artemisia annua]
MDTSQSDPVTQTGLEEPMWQLGLASGGGSESYPERPDEPDCIYYLRTGFCGYGSRCRFNHPTDRAASVVGAMRLSGGEYPERIGQPVCQYYMRTGMCKFGASCKYHHPRQGAGSSSTVPLNASGYPLRPGEKECSYYVKTGQCKFGVTCKFHHPQPTAIMQAPLPPQAPPQESVSSIPSALYQSMQPPVPGNWPVTRPSPLPGSYFPGTYGPVLLPPGMVPYPGWNPYQAPVSPAASPSTVGAGPYYAMPPHLSPPGPSYAGSYLSMASSTIKEQSFPQRPGEPECQYYLKTGDCKFGSSCRYHHPPEWTAPNTNFVLSPMGLPLRPGAPLCTHYAQKGVCKFGPSCKFDHPMGTLSYSPSASSLADMPVAPYPVGSSIATLAPSSSSSELRPELISASSKDGLSTSMPSVSGGSSLSQSMPLSESTGGSSTTHGGDAPHSA